MHQALEALFLIVDLADWQGGTMAQSLFCD